MDSTSRDQSEHNREDLVGRSSVQKIRELVEKSDTCFFCTAVTVANSVGARPMAVQEVDDAGTLWFLSSDESHKNEELETNPTVRLYFQASTHSEFLMLQGIATVSRDQTRIKHLWKPLMKTWFTEGETDPRIRVISVDPSYGYYWDTKHGMAIAGIKMLIGAAIGKTLDDSVEGTLRV